MTLVETNPSDTVITDETHKPPEQLQFLTPELKRLLLATLAIWLIITLCNHISTYQQSHTSVLPRPNIAQVNAVIQAQSADIQNLLVQMQTSTDPQQITIDPSQQLRLRTRSSAYDLQYEGIFYRFGELELNPSQLTTDVNFWMNGEYPQESKLGCFGDKQNGQTLQIATWFYPCGTIVKVTNPRTAQFVFAEVTDRGPNRYYQGQGYENDRARKHGIDASPLFADAQKGISLISGEKVIVEPVIFPPGSNAKLGPIVDLTQSPMCYQEITSQGQFTGITPIDPISHRCAA